MNWFRRLINAVTEPFRKTTILPSDPLKRKAWAAQCARDSEKDVSLGEEEQARQAALMEQPMEQQPAPEGAPVGAM